MSVTDDSTPQQFSRFGSLTNVAKARLVAFTLVVIALLGLNLTMTPTEVLTAAATGWLQDFGIHQIHDMTIAALMWVLLHAALVLLLYRPTGRVNTVLAPIILEVPVMVFAFLADSFLLMGFVIGSVLAFAAIVLHPAGRALLRIDRVETVDRRAAALFVVGAIPLVGYAGLEAGKQLGPVDEHVAFVHFGAMAIAAIYVVIMGGLSIVRRHDWRFAVWSAGLIAAYVGLVSIAFPSRASSLGVAGGALLVLWAVAFVGAVETGRRNGSTPTDELLEEPEANLA